MMHKCSYTFFGRAHNCNIYVFVCDLCQYMFFIPADEFAEMITEPGYLSDWVIFD
jgi:hypothetical protein